MADTIGRPLGKSYWSLDQGIWSPRDQTWGWREWDTFDTKAKALKAAQKLLKDDPTYPLLLTEVRGVMVWNEEKPEWDKSEPKTEAPSVEAP